MFGEGDGLADLLLERFGERLELLCGERRSGGDVGGDFAAALGCERLEGLDDRRQSEQAAVARHDLHEIGNGGIELGFAQDRLGGARLLVGADQRRAQEAADIVALSAQLLVLDKPGFDGIHRTFGLAQIKQRCRIRPRDLGQHRILLCQCRSTPVAGGVQNPLKTGSF